MGQTGAFGGAGVGSAVNTSFMDTFNLHRGETVADESDPPGYHVQSAQLAPRFGASRLAMTVYDLPPGQAICPYHFHWGDEEWLVVVSGTPTVRTPDGEQMLDPGDVVCFPVGPDGAHRVHNASDDAARVAIFSNKARVRDHRVSRQRQDRGLGSPERVA